MSEKHNEPYPHQRTYARFVLAMAFASVAYCLLVLWYVATFPDIGLRCLLPLSDSESPYSIPITQFTHSDSDCIPYVPNAGEELVEINRKPVRNFLEYVDAVAQLRSATIPPGGQLAAGSDPVEWRKEVPGLVEIASGEEGVPGVRMVELTFRRPESSRPDFDLHTYVAIKPLKAGDFFITILWFLSQLAILVVALTAFLQRISDRVVRTFCWMCCVSMVAFVGGFHWWILAASPLLNLPFIFCASLLPAATLHFFCSFPLEKRFLKEHPRWAALLIYAPLAGIGVVLCFVYWAAYSLNATGTDAAVYSSFQKLAAIGSALLRNGSMHFNGPVVSTSLLLLLRTLVYAAILMSSVYFLMTVASLTLSLRRTQNPIERRQASGILTASLISTVPIAYTLYLAFFRKVDFALGRAQLPMFAASGLFMVAYAHGMLRHRLILADDLLQRGRQYSLITGLVTVGIAMLLATATVATRIYALPFNSSIPLQLSLFLLIVVAFACVIWARDRLQSVVDRRFFSEKYQLDKTLNQLNQAAGYLTDPSAMAGLTLQTCREVINASTAAMFVREASGTFRLIGIHSDSEELAALPRDLQLNEILPQTEGAELVIRRVPSENRESMTKVQELMYDLHAELICFLRDEQGIDGIILLGRRASGSAYSAEDIAFLQAIGQMTVLALHSSRANQNLARLNDELKVKVTHIAEQQRQLAMLRAELTNQQVSTHAEAQTGDGTGFDRGEIRGNSRPVRQVLDMARKAASSSSNVLIRGESGTGKELLARIVHRNSDRGDKPLISVNCAALAPSLLESELFGHVRGAYTGAHSNKAGRFEAADGGTLFLDEIGDISLETQVKLLRVLQERCFEPVGSNETHHVDVRLITATNRQLEQMIAKGGFREDLYYRLNVISMTLPPLRERHGDLIELVFFFLNRAVQKTRKQIRQIEPEALAVLEAHSWPGNIRELENVIERAVVLADGDTIQSRDLPVPIRDQTPMPDEQAARDEWRELDFAEELHERRNRPSRDLSDERSEKTLLAKALDTSGGNKTKAARLLGMPRSTLFSKLKKHGLTD